MEAPKLTLNDMRGITENEYGYAARNLVGAAMDAGLHLDEAAEKYPELADFLHAARVAAERHVAAKDAYDAYVAASITGRD